MPKDKYILNENFDQKYLKSILHYNPKTGIFIWKIKPAINTNVGDVAGCIDKSENQGYIKIKIKYKSYKAHRLAWLYMTGEWPKYEIDHKDRNRVNNIWTNLRIANDNGNARNKGKPRNNTSGYKGVSKGPSTKRGDIWIAQIIVNTKHIYLGRFRTPEEAYIVYCKAAKQYHGKFARLE